MTATAHSMPPDSWAMHNDDDIIDGYLAELDTIGRSPRTCRLRAYQLRAWSRFLSPGGSLIAAQRRDVIDYLGRVRDIETRASNRAALSGLYQWMRWVGLRQSSPLEWMPPGKRRAPEPRPCPDDVVQSGLAAATKPGRHGIILARFAGLRVSEAAAVHTDDTTYRPEHLRVIGKGDKIRYVPLHPEVEQLLAQVGDGYVFPGRTATRDHWQGGAVGDHIARALPGHWTAHTLRHAFATELYERTGDMVIVQETLGHASIDTTRRYVRVNRDRAVQGVRSLRLVTP